MHLASNRARFSLHLADFKGGGGGGGGEEEEVLGSK